MKKASNNNNITEEETKPSKFQIWKLASRPHTLTASIVPVIVGYALTIRLINDNSRLLVTQRFLDCAIDDDGRETCSDATSYQDTTTATTTLLLPIALQFGIFACLIQISTNLHNDYADYVKGADTNDRVGQARATQKGWLTPYETCRGCMLCMMAALVVGMHYLIPVGDTCSISSSNSNDGRSDSSSSSSSIAPVEVDYIMIFVVLSSLFNAVAYTGGPFPLGYIGLEDISLGYSGLGDVFVFIYFGIVATVGVPYMYLTKVACLSFKNQQQQQLLMQLLYPSILHSIPIGCLATAIIVVNNLRDRHTDVIVGKKTLAVRFGGTFAKIEYFILVLCSYGFCIYLWYMQEEEKRRGQQEQHLQHSYMALLPLLSFPLAIPQLLAVSFGKKDGQALNDHVGGTAKVQMIYCILMAIGLIHTSSNVEDKSV